MIAMERKGKKEGWPCLSLHLTLEFFFIFSPPHRSHPLNIIISDQSAVEPLVVVCTTYTFSFCATIFFLFIFKIIFHFKKEKGEQYFIDEISIFLLESFSSIDDSVEM
jgi:hypothetical protein